MKKNIIFSVFIFIASINVSAQQPAPQSTPAPPAAPNQAEENRRTILQQQQINGRFEALKRANQIYRTPGSNQAAVQNIRNIYRKPTKEEFKLLAPDKEDLKTYAQFLRQPDTGLIKLIAGRGCDENTNVVNVSGDCLKYSMPGAGASYSFRTENYRIRHLSDLTYIDNSFQLFGILAHGILVDLGDIPLEQISLQTRGLKFLTSFEPITDFEKAKEIDRQFVRGVKNEDFFYSRRAAAAENTTYVLRSIAYRGNRFRSARGFVYDELGFDERRDITVAFRVIRRDNESVVILWKALSNQKSPVIKRPDPKPSKLKENKFVAGNQ